jgi:uncharacterized protein YegL
MTLPNYADLLTACVLILDTSATMSEVQIEELNAGLAQFIEELSRDNVARARLEVAIITFGPAQVVQVFAPIAHIHPPKLEAMDDAPLGAALNLAIDCVQDRNMLYRDNGISFYPRPWIFLISKGAPTDGDAWAQAAQRVKKEDQNKKLLFYAVGVEGADMNVLNSISNRPALKLKGYSFAEMFVWLETGNRLDSDCD